MDEESIRNHLKHRVSKIISAIDLNYILAEAQKEKYDVNLIYGNIEDKIKWSNNTCNLSYNYEISTGILYQFISVHRDKIIKINISSINNIFPLNRNIIIYVPYEMNINKIKKEYKRIVEFT